MCMGTSQGGPTRFQRDLRLRGAVSLTPYGVKVKTNPYGSKDWPHMWGEVRGGRRKRCYNNKKPALWILVGKTATPFYDIVNNKNPILRIWGVALKRGTSTPK